MDDNKAIMKTMKYMEEKLIELMGEEAYREFALATGKRVFLEEIEEMGDCNFKFFTLEHFDEIVGGVTIE